MIAKSHHFCELLGRGEWKALQAYTASYGRGSHPVSIKIRNSYKSCSYLFRCSKTTFNNMYMLKYSYVLSHCGTNLVYTS